MSERLLTAEEVAERLAVSVRYVWRLGRDGKLPAVKIGRYTRFAESDVDAFIEAGRQRPAARVGATVLEKPKPHARPTGSTTIRRRRRFP